MTPNTCDFSKDLEIGPTCWKISDPNQKSCKLPSSADIKNLERNLESLKNHPKFSFDEDIKVLDDSTTQAGLILGKCKIYNPKSKRIKNINCEEVKAVTFCVEKEQTY